MTEGKDSRIMTIIQFEGVIVIGMVDGDQCHQPRVVGRDQKGHWQVLNLLGDPDYIWIGTFLFAFEPKTNDPIRLMYTQAVTGIILTKQMPNIPPPGDGDKKIILKPN